MLVIRECDTPKVMPFLIAFVFLAGIVTVLSPYILPVLPVLLSDSVEDAWAQQSKHSATRTPCTILYKVSFFERI